RHPAPIGDRDLPAGYENLPHIVARQARRHAAEEEARRRAAEEDARRLAADPDDRVPPSATPERYLPAVDQGFAEVNGRLDSLTQQLSQLAQRGVSTVPISGPEPRDEEHDLGEIKERLDSLTQQLGQHAQMHVA